MKIALGINQTIDVPLVLTETTPGSGTYAITEDPFFPIDGQGFGNDIPGYPQHNFNFTAEFHGSFTYHGGEVLSTASDDDNWVFINNRLVIDAGGTHGHAGGTADLDALNQGQYGADPLGLIIGQTYPIDIFYAERQTNHAELQVQTDIQLVPDRPYTYPVHAIDPDGDPVTYALLQAPIGMTIDAATGLISWQPARDQIGSYTVSVQASDGRGGFSDPQIYTLVVQDPAGNADPVFQPPYSSTRVHLGDTYAYRPNVTDADGDPLTFTLATHPDGMSIDRYSGAITWKPSTTDVNGDFLVTVQASDGRGGTGTLQFHLTVDRIGNTDPAFDPPSPALVGAVGQPYSYQAHAHDAEADPLTYDLPVHPAGMIVAPDTGLVLWVPTGDEVGPQDVILRVRDGQGGVALQPFTVTVAPRDLPPQITSPPLWRAQAGRTYNYPVRAMDPDAGDTLTFHLADPHPVGMGINSSTGLLTWPGALVGTYHIDISVDDGRGGVGTQGYDLQVVDQPNGWPTITSPYRTSIQLGRTYRYQVVATDPDGDPLTYGLAPDGDPLPAGLAITTAGLVTWTPTADQLLARPTTSFHVTVDDQRGGTDDQLVTIHLVEQGANGDPTITSPASRNAVAGRNYVYPVLGDDPDGDPLAWSLDVHPDGMVIDPITGVLAWAPTVDQIGAHGVTIRVSDGQGGFAIQSYTVTVRGEDLPPRFVPPTPPTATEHSTYAFQVHAVDPEGEALTFALAPIPGVTYPTGLSVSPTGLLSWSDPTPLGPQEVAIRIEDEAGNVVIQGFTIPVAAPATNHPPKFTSDPARAAAVGATYRYTLAASDPDGDSPLTFTLQPGSYPSGMTLTGNLVEWTPTAATPAGAPTMVTVVVTDPSGAQGFQTFPITVIDDHAPTLDPIPDATRVVGQPFRYDVQATDPDPGDTLAYLLTGPGWLHVDAAGRITGTPALGDRGVGEFQLVATDAYGKSSPIRTFHVTVGDDVTAPTARLAIIDNPSDLGRSVTILVTADDDVGVTGLFLTVGGLPVTLDGHGAAIVTPDQAGDYAVVATATDAAGHSAQAADVLHVIQPGAPALTSTLHLLRDPFDPDANHRDHLFGQAGGPPVVTAPIDVVGTAADPLGQPVSYTLAFAPIDGSTYTTFATGSSAVADGVLGRFDPTMLANGAYAIRLTVHRPGVADAVDERIVSVEGSLKLGNLHLSFADLTIPVAGIPITITRSYDTLNAGEDGDFGYGWTLDEGDFQLQVSQPDGSLRPVGLHEGFRQGTRVVVTRPGMDPEVFIFNPHPITYGYTTSPYYQPSFDPAPGTGTTSQLTVSSDAELILVGDEFFNLDAELTPYNPADPVANTSRAYTLTTRDKTAYAFDAETGRLSTVSDRHGNTLYYDDWGITSDTGRKVTFTRDPATHHITAITDPRGNTITYDYDPVTGDLTSVTDRAGATTQFVYRTDRPHYLDHVVDPLGRTAVTASYDGDGRLSGLTDALGNGATLGYDLDNLSATVATPLTNPATVIFDALGNPIKQIASDGSVTLRQFSGRDLVAETRVVGLIDDPSNGEQDDLTTTYTHDAFGAVLSMTDPQGHTTWFTYGPDGLPSTSTNAVGDKTTYGFDDQGNLTSLTSPTGMTMTTAYDAQGDLRSITTPNGTTTYDYNVYGDVIQITDVRGNVTTTTYDANGNPLGSHRVWVDPADPTHTVAIDVVNAYDDDDRLIETTGPEGTTHTHYDDDGRAYETIDALGNATTTIFDAAGRSIQTTNPDGTVSATVYDAAGRVVWSDDPHRPGDAADGTHTIYDAAGRVIATERRANLVITVATPSGAPASSALADAGSAVSISATVYDAAGRVVWADGPHAPGQPVGATHWVYDAAGRVIATERYSDTVLALANPDTDPSIALTLGTLYSSTSTTADAAGRTLTGTDAIGHVTRYEYDGDGRVTRTVFDDGSSVSTVYDAAGRKIADVDQLGQRTDYQYDQYGQLTAVLLPAVPDPDANNRLVRPVYHYEYDDYGDLIGVRDPLSQQQPNGSWGRETTFAYDELGRKVEHTLPMGQVETWTYDALGRLAEHIDFLGQRAEYAYDALGRLATKDLYGLPDPMQWPPDPDPAPTQTVAYAYDQYDANGLRHDATTVGAAVTDDAYDRDGQLVQVTSPEGTVHYEYDPATGQETRAWTGADPNAPTTDLRYGYDQFGRLTSVRAVRLDGAAVSLTTTYAYDAADRLITTNLPNGTVETRGYDDLDRLTSIVTTLTADPGQVIAGFTYTLDAAGHRVRVVESTGRQVDYAYDALGRLTSEAITNDPGGDRTITYTYDLASNRRTKHDSAASEYEQDTYYGYDANDELLSVSAGMMGWTSYAYDANGATTSVTGSESAAYAYDLEGRMVHASANGHSIDYAYDDAGHRVSQTIDGQKTTYLNDITRAYDQVLEEYAPGGILAATYVRGIDLLFQDRSGTRSYYAKDGLGSTRTLTDQSGAATDAYAYDADGEQTASTGTTANDYLFAGYRRDGATGLDYLNSRYYDAATARFISRDSYNGRTADPITQNHYLYASADPVDRIDPSGHDSFISTLGASSIGAEIDAIEGEAAQHVLESVKDVSEGVSIDQAILNRAMEKGTDAAMNVAMSMGVAALLMAGKKVVGFAKIGGELVRPGTILPRSREIPGIPGLVTGRGNSTTLLRRLLKANKVSARNAKGYAAHHLIPVAVARESRAINKIGMDIDDATNGILLPSPAVHLGSHDEYSRAVATALDMIPDDLSVDETMDRVYEIQARAAWAFADGKVMVKGSRLDTSEWLSILTGGSP